MNRNYLFGTTRYFAPSDQGGGGRGLDAVVNQQGGTGTGQGSGQGNGNQNQGGGNNQGGKQDTTPKNPLDSFKDFWNTKNVTAQPGNNQGGAGGNNQGGGNNNQGGGNQGNGTGNNPGGPSAMDNYVAKQNFFDGVDTQAMQTAFEKQDFGAFQTQMKSMLANVFKSGLKAADAIAKNYKDEAVTESGNKFNTSYNLDQGYRNMFSKFEGLQHPAIAPVAKTQFKKALDQGKTPDEAAKLVNDYWVAAGNHMVPNGTGNRQRGDGNSGNGNNDEPSLDFDSLFTQG